MSEERVLFCPVCQCPAEQLDKAGFIELGEYDEFRNEYEAEGDVEVWKCKTKGCKEEFYI